MCLIVSLFLFINIIYFPVAVHIIILFIPLKAIKIMMTMIMITVSSNFVSHPLREYPSLCSILFSHLISIAALGSRLDFATYFILLS